MSRLSSGYPTTSHHETGRYNKYGIVTYVRDGTYLRDASELMLYVVMESTPRPFCFVSLPGGVAQPSQSGDAPMGAGAELVEIGTHFGRALNLVSGWYDGAGFVQTGRPLLVSLNLGCLNGRDRPGVRSTYPG